MHVVSELSPDGLGSTLAQNQREHAKIVTFSRETDGPLDDG